MDKTISLTTFIPDPTKNYPAELTRVVNIIYKRFQSEANEGNRTYALEALSDYVYVITRYHLWSGRYVRYIDMSDALDMKLRLGGFVVDDNGFTVTLKNNEHIFQVCKKNKLFFMRFNEEDNFRKFVSTLQQ